MKVTKVIVIAIIIIAAMLIGIWLLVYRDKGKQTLVVDKVQAEKSARRSILVETPSDESEDEGKNDLTFERFNKLLDEYFRNLGKSSTSAESMESKSSGRNEREISRSEEEEWEQIIMRNLKKLEEEIKVALTKAEQILPVLRSLDAELAARGGYRIENESLIRKREEYIKEAADLEAFLWDDEFVELFGGWPRNTKIAQELHDYFYKERPPFLPSLEERRRWYMEHPEAAKRFIEECQKILQEHPNVKLSENIMDELRVAYEALNISR